MNIRMCASAQSGGPGGGSGGHIAVGNDRFTANVGAYDTRTPAIGFTYKF